MSTTITSRDLVFKLLYGEVAQHELLKLLEQSKPDILALITRKRNFIERIFDKSLSKKMVNHIHTPILVFSS